MKICKPTMDLTFFGNSEKDFFTNAFEEAYNIGEVESEVTDTPSDAPEATESVSNEQVEEIPIEKEEAPQSLSKEEIKALYEQHYGKSEKQEIKKEEPVLDEQAQSALELYKYLEENPHLVQAMREVDVEGYQQLNSFVPDEVTRKVQELEEYIQEQKYNAYVNDLKTKYNDFDEDKVLEYAEQHEVYDLEIAYKALKAETIKEPDIDTLKAQIREELLAELKQNSLSTQTIVGSVNQKPINQTEVSLSSREQRIARAMGMSNEEYAKWR